MSEVVNGPGQVWRHVYWSATRLKRIFAGNEVVVASDSWKARAVGRCCEGHVAYGCIWLPLGCTFHRAALREGQLGVQSCSLAARVQRMQLALQLPNNAPSAFVQRVFQVLALRLDAYVGCISAVEVGQIRVPVRTLQMRDAIHGRRCRDAVAARLSRSCVWVPLPSGDAHWARHAHPRSRAPWLIESRCLGAAGAWAARFHQGVHSERCRPDHCLGLTGPWAGWQLCAEELRVRIMVSGREAAQLYLAHVQNLLELCEKVLGQGLECRQPQGSHRERGVSSLARHRAL